MKGYRYWPSLLNEETRDFIGPARYCYTVMPDYGGAYLWGKNTRMESGGLLLAVTSAPPDPVASPPNHGRLGAVIMPGLAG